MTAAERTLIAVVLDRSAGSLCGFVESTVAPGSLIVTDDWSGYAGLGKRGYEHFAVAECGDPEVAEQYLPIIHLVTIHHWTETGQLDRDLAAGARWYAPRPLVAHKLDPYTAIIDARLEAFPKLSAKRLFDEVRAAGYPGGYGRVRDYVLETRPREPVEAPVRFETPPGHQGQVDFGTFTLPWGRRHAAPCRWRPCESCASKSLCGPDRGLSAPGH